MFYHIFIVINTIGVKKMGVQLLLIHPVHHLPTGISLMGGRGSIATVECFET